MTINAGDIAFLGLNTSNPDQFAMLAVNAIAEGEVFYITDGGFTGSNTGVANTTFRANEGFLQYTAPTGGIGAGTVLVFNAGGGVSASVSSNGGGAAGTATLLSNGSNSTSFVFSSSGEQLTAYAVAGGDHLTGAPTLLAFIDAGRQPYGGGSAESSSIPVIAGGQVLNLANADNAIFSNTANAYAQDIAALSDSRNFSQRESQAYDLTSLASATHADISISDVVIREGDAGTVTALFTVTRSTNINSFDVSYQTTDGTALAGADYVASSGTLSFTAGGALSQTISVIINGEQETEPSETFLVNLSGLTATLGSAILADGQGLGTIRNDDTTLTQLSAGDADRDSAVLLAKLSQAGTVTFQIATDAGFGNIVVSQDVTVADALTPAKLALADGTLSAGTQYYWRATDEFGKTATASFRTADADGVRDGFTFGVTGDWRGELAPYPAINNVAAQDLDLFIKLGDTIYADYPSPALNQPQAITLTDYLTKHNEVYSAKGGLDAWGELQASTAILATIDDHEVINDFAGGAPAASDPRFGETTGLVNDTALYETGLTAFTAYNAIEDRSYADTGLDARTDGERDLYRYSLQGQDAAVYVLDARSFRDAELAPVTNLVDPTQITNFIAASATQDRTMLGDAQLARLKADLLDAQSKGVVWKFIQVPEPIQNFGVLGAEDRFEGYARERTEILKFINDNDLTGVVFVAADIHGTVVNNLTYQEFPGGPQIAVAAWEITTGSVAFDAPFGQTVAGIAGLAGLLTPQASAFYNSLPVAPDTDSALNDRDDFIASLINQQITPLGYDPVGLNNNLAQTNGLIDATLLSGDYLVTHGYGWTKFDVDAATGDLTVTTYAVPYYSEAQALADPSAIAALTPTVQAQFIVRATIDESITGTVAGETLDAGAGRDTISALDGADTITAGYGDDSIDGGAGADIVVFQGSRAAASITNTGLGAWTVTTATGGTDTLTNVEQLQFADGLFGGATPTANSGIDLSIYKLVARYDLPEPTRTAAPPNSVLAQEVSGVTYNWDTDTLFVVGDGGTSVVQVSKTGELIDSMTLAQGSSPQGTEFYDPEGITYLGDGLFVMTEERDRRLVQFTYEAGRTLGRTEVFTVTLGTNVGNAGFEGVSWDPQTNGFIVVKEIAPLGIFQTTVDFAAGTASNGSPTATGSVDLFDPALLGLSDIADVFALSNLTALNGQTQSGNLLVLSQENGRIVNVDRLGNITSTLDIVSNPGNPLSVASQQHEGLTVGADGTLYVVSENGGGSFDRPQLWVYKPSALPNQAPTALALNNPLTTLVENSSTATRIKLADVAITDDGIGTNIVTLSGADAGFFEVDVNGLYLRAGTVLDFETKASYTVTVNVDDASLGATPDAQAGYTLNLTDVTNENPAQPVLFISEVAPWSSGNSPVGVDWFEVTNAGPVAIDITGWRIDDNSNSFASSVALSGITSIAAGESVIFLETANLASVGTSFINTWFGGTAPAGLRLGSYTGGGVGLSTNGDAVNLYSAAGVLQANVVFGASPTAAPFATFNNAAGLNNATITTASAVGENGAAAALASTTTEIGSPGTVGRLFISEVAPWSSGNSPVAADWFEVTNSTGLAIDITGWRIDDNSGSPAAAVALTGITSIGAGETVIFLETANLAATRATFIDTWFGGTAPSTLKFGAYSGGGVGLGAGGAGDAVNLYDAGGVLRASVSFPASPTGTFASFDNAGGLNGVAINTLSANGVNGAFFAAADPAELASPGQIANNPALIVGTPAADTLAGLAGNETINGAAGNDSITGGEGQDTLDGGLGDDLLAGGLGADSLIGGAGFDTASYADAAAGLTLRLDFANLNTGEAAGDTLTGIERILGSAFDDTLVGSFGGQTLVGNGGSDILIGRSGADILAGGAGQDFFAFAAEDFEAGVYDVIQDANADGVMDFFVTGGVARESLLVAEFGGGVVVSTQSLGFGLAGGGIYIENFAVSDFWGQLLSL